MDARSRRRGLTNGLASGRALPPAPGRVNGTRGATNGLVNGTRGRTNGLVNGTHGRTNGLVNGTRGRTNGLVNGTGAVNGSGFVNGLPLRRNPFGIVTHRDLRRSASLLAVSVVAIVVLGYILTVPPGPGSRFSVDGDFEEWAGIPEHGDDLDSAASGNLTATKVQEDGGRVFLYAETADLLFAGPEASSVYVLVSVDGLDGYGVAPGFPAVFVAEAYGWDDALRGTVLREWTGGSTDPDNATALVSRGAFPAAAAGREIEVALDPVDLGLDASAQVWFRFATRAGADADLGPIMGREPGGLLVRQEQNPLVPTITGESPALRLTFSALAADIQVRDLALDVPPGTGYTLPSLPHTVVADTNWTVNVAVSPGVLSSGSLYTARVRAVDAVLANDTVKEVRATISGDGARAYVGAAPQGHAIDGLFDDWANRTLDGDDDVPASVDIRESAVALTSGAFFYVGMDGDVLAGALLPVRHTRPVPGNASAPPPSPAPIRRVAGEDVLRIYVDTDDRDAVGLPFGGLVADRLIEVRGRLGRITATSLYAWDAAASAWEARAGPLDVAFAGAEIEAFAPPTFLGATSNASVAFAASDWSGAGDEADVLGLRGTRGAPALRPRHGSGAVTIVATSLGGTPSVDGDCATTGNEYLGANQNSNDNMTVHVGRRDDTQYLFVCAEVTADTSDNGALDWGELLFDRNHDGTDPPQDGDRRFRIASAPVTLTMEKGTGTGGWTACGTDCDGGDIGAGEYRNGVEVYEFRIRYSDVWGTNFPTGNQQAGFAVVAHDETLGVDLTWGSDEVDENAPSTWGMVEIPEFPPALAASVAALAFLLRRTRRRSRAANP